MKIRAGDNVVIITGKDKGKTGQVLRTLHAKNRVVVTDVNIRTRHMKAGPNRPGEIIKYEASLSASNVMLIDPKSKKRSRLGFKKNEKGKKTRIFKQSGDEVKKTAMLKKKEEKDSKALDAAEKKTTTKAPKEGLITSSTDKKSPFWKKMGFGAEEIASAGEVEAGSHMSEDHSVPDQVERQSGRTSQRGS
jgi:large subunit ribosomal protein L24